ncbi:MAG: hypothetical protein DRN27_09455 [Thermoplasmata archaeon]|nr:MAG: hypothetical protein DRN27_09455 [Thermoplasmata archaeon]
MKNLLLISLFTFFAVSLNAQSDILPPNLIAPENGALDQMPDGTLNWYASSGVGQVSYTVEIADNMQFDNSESFITSITEFKNSNLRFGEEYFWRISATDDEETSDWSDVYSFTVFDRLLLDEPLNGAADQMPNVILSREEDAGDNDYSGFNLMQCQIDTSYGLATENIDLTEEDLNSIYFVDEASGWTAGEAGTILAYDAGTWSIETIYSGATNEDTTITAGLNSIHNGHIVGNEGTYLYYDVDMWKVEPIELESDNKEVAITEDLNSVFALSSEDIWAVGPEAYIIHKGTSEYWELSDSNLEEPEDMNAVFFLDENNGWAVGAGDSILYYNGTEWTAQYNPAERDLYDVYFTDMNHGWAVGKLGTLVFYDGTQWNELESNTGSDLYSIFMLNSEEGWAVGKNGTLVNFDGSFWYVTASSSLNDLNSTYAVNANNIWIAGEEGTVITKIGEGFDSELMEVYTTIGDSLNIHMNNLLFGTRYYWRFRAIHDEDTSSWSSARYFSTIGVVELVSPDQNATNQDPDIELEWLEITGIDSYIYQVCNDPDFIFPCITGFVDSSSIIIPDLFFGDTYYWRVSAAHYADTTDWSEVRSFEVINTVLLDSPSDGASSVALLPTLSWEAINGADEYEVRWSNEDNSYLDTAFVNTTSFLMFKPLEYAEDYFWKVRAIKNGDTTDWSDTWQFYTGPTSIGDISFNDHNISIFPNPTNGQLTIEINSFETTQIDVSIIDLMGKVAKEQSFTIDQGLSKNLMQLDELNKGIYLIKLQSGNDVYTKKLIVD